MGWPADPFHTAQPKLRYLGQEAGGAPSEQFDVLLASPGSHTQKPPHTQPKFNAKEREKKNERLPSLRGKVGMCFLGANPVT